MQHACCLDALVGDGDAVAITRWDAVRLGRVPPKDAAMLRVAVDTAGRLSAVAQGLAAPVTDLARVASREHTLYLAAQRDGRGMRVLGLAKSGRKKLFLRPAGCGPEVLREVTPVCLLDFYVHESVQRAGWGLKLFEALLRGAGEAQKPEALGYDRPSPKLLAFMAKHFRLDTYMPQANSYVVFEPHFWVEHGWSTGLVPGGSRASAYAEDTEAAPGKESAEAEAARQAERARWTSVSQRPLSAVQRGPRRPAGAAVKPFVPPPVQAAGSSATVPAAAALHAPPAQAQAARARAGASGGSLWFAGAGAP